MLASKVMSFTFALLALSIHGHPMRSGGKVAFQFADSYAPSQWDPNSNPWTHNHNDNSDFSEEDLSARLLQKRPRQTLATLLEEQSRGQASNSSQGHKGSRKMLEFVGKRRMYFLLPFFLLLTSRGFSLTFRSCVCLLLPQ